jgi:hypothetical protein
VRRIGIIEGRDIWLNDDGSISFRAKFAVDVDGSGDSHGDTCYQPDTSLHLNGKPLNADIDRYVVTPPLIIESVPGIILGCQAKATNTENEMESPAVVGDIGPWRKLGEGSRALALALGLSGSPISGGTDRPIIEYVFYPGRAAIVGARQYQLQAYRG